MFEEKPAGVSEDGGHSAPLRTLEETTPPSSRINFAQASQKIAQEIIDFNEVFAAAAIQTNDDEFSDVERQIEIAEEGLRQTRFIAQTEKVRRFLVEFEELMGELTLPGAGHIGKNLIRKLREAQCKYTIIPPDPNGGTITTEDSEATYSSYSFGKSNRGFAHEIGLRPHRISDRLSFFRAKVHEEFHALQTLSAEALNHGPFNPDNNIVIHPEDWYMVERLCEKDAYTKQAMVSMLIARKFPEMRERTSFDVVSVDDFEKAMKETGTLEDAVVKTALSALSKIKYVKEPEKGTFEDVYGAIALKNYSAGMFKRRDEGQEGLIFVRLEEKDFWAIGNYGVGPNSLGEYFMEPLLLKRRPLSLENQTEMDSICRQYNIPPLHQCHTLGEVLDGDHLETEQPLPQRKPVLPGLLQMMQGRQAGTKTTQGPAPQMA